MRIHMLWMQWEGDRVELLFALDDATVAENRQAWEDGCAASRKRYGIAPEDTRTAILAFPLERIAALFDTPVVDASVQS